MPLFLLNMILNRVVPFVVLLPKPTKRMGSLLAKAAAVGLTRTLSGSVPDGSTGQRRAEPTVWSVGSRGPDRRGGALRGGFRPVDA
jgi:hypothetical protein